MKTKQTENTLMFCDDPLNVINKLNGIIDIGTILTELPSFNGQEDDFDNDWIDDTGYLKWCLKRIETCSELIQKGLIIIGLHNRFLSMLPNKIGDFSASLISICDYQPSVDGECGEHEFVISDFIMYPYITFGDMVVVCYQKNIENVSFNIKFSKIEQKFPYHKISPDGIKSLLTMAKGVIIDPFMRDGLIRACCEKDQIYIGIEQNQPLFDLFSK